MSEKCKACPTYGRCIGLEGVVAVRRRGIFAQRGHLEAALKANDEMQISGALSILSGEITAEQHDGLRKKLEALPSWKNVDYGAKFKRLNDEEAATETVMDRIVDVSVDLEECEGPRLGRLREIMFSYRHRNDSPDHRDIRYQSELIHHGICGSPGSQAEMQEIERLLNFQDRQTA
jgi:hypothetical protein